MATLEWTFLLMNVVPGRGQTFVDNWVAKLFPAANAEGFQSVDTELGPNISPALRLQWSHVDNTARIAFASRVLLLRYHVKLLLAFVVFSLMSLILIFLPPLLLFALSTTIVAYILLICSYTAFASYLIITEKSIIVAVPRWKHRWLIHLNLLFPQLANWLSGPYNNYHFITYESRLIAKIETPTYQDNSCKLLMDYKSGMHLLTDAAVMDHFASSSSIRAALERLDRSSDDSMEGNVPRDDSRVEPLDPSPPMSGNRGPSSEFALTARQKDRMD